MASAKPNLYWQPRINESFDQTAQVYRWDVIPVATRQRLRVDILEWNCSRDKAVDLTVFAGKGAVVCGGEAARQMLLWASTGKWCIECEVDAPQGLLTIRHATLTPAHGGNPSYVTSAGDYRGMLVEHHGSSHTYRCNDGWADDSFDKLVFRVTLIDCDSEQSSSDERVVRIPTQGAGVVSHVDGCGGAAVHRFGHLDHRDGPG